MIRRLPRIASSLPRRSLAAPARTFAASAYRLAMAARELVKIVEVGPRDGLQNEKAVTSPAVKAELINRLAGLGLAAVEAGSFVSPKWVPQMGGTPEVLSRVHARPETSYPVLVPNTKGLDDFLALRVANPALSGFDEIAIFTAATDAFSRANTNCTVADSLARLAPVAKRATEAGLRVRGYVSVVVACPYSGPVAPKKVAAVAKALHEMGCYEVSLGDTVGEGTPDSVRAMLEAVAKEVPVAKLAGHFHDTYGMGVANVLAALDAGVRTVDCSVAGLGGCPFSPGATGNVATEDVLYAIRSSTRYATVGGAEDRLDDVAAVGWWISAALGRETTSRVGRAIQARKEREKREEALREEAKAKL